MLRLHLAVSQAEAHAVLQQYRSRALASWPGLPPPDGTATVVPAGLLYALSDTQPLTPDYLVVVLTANGGTSTYWNHGRATGIAVSETRGEVIYWAQTW